MENCVSLNEIQRQLELTIVAFWEHPFRVLPLQSDNEIPTIKSDSIYLPQSFVQNPDSDKSTFLSAALHAAAHLVFSEPQDSANLNNRQLVLISLFEDARIEYLATQQFPGLRKLFASQFKKHCNESLQFNDIAYSIAYALAKEEVSHQSSLVSKYVKLFNQALLEDAYDTAKFKSIGLALANDIGQMRISMNEREVFRIVDYRDDNAYLWNEFEQVGVSNNEGVDSSESLSVTGVAYKEVHDGKFVSGFDSSVEDEAGLVFTESSEDRETTLLNKTIKQDSYLYPEWDYKIGRWKQDWCSVNEKLLANQKIQDVATRLEPYQGFVRRLQKVVQTYQSQMHRRKKQIDGLELDLDAILEAVIDIKGSGLSSEPRIYIDHTKQKQEELVLLVLIDLSESMNDRCPGVDDSLLDLTLDSVLVLSELMELLGYPIAVHGFNSDGRQNVSYFPFKEFNQSSESSYAFLNAIEAGFSTRLGSALRHAQIKISKRDERHKMILVITDGEPSDIDVFDDNYLIEDAVMAVRNIKAQGCQTFALSLDKQADKYVQRLFGKAHYEIIDHPEKMSSVMTKLCIKMFKAVMA